tara:strand:- start:1000 stop:1146 length:147 start_codon:yes stop_codon:yes gene_type:complete
VVFVATTVKDHLLYLFAQGSLSYQRTNQLSLVLLFFAGYLTFYLGVNG